MTNIMSMANVKNRPSRNGFDISAKNGFTAKVGELLPVLVADCLAGDKFKIRTDWFTRTKPLQTSAFTRMREYYDFYFVPYRLLWRYADNFFTQMNIDNSSTLSSFSYKNPQTVSLPWFNSQDIADYLNSLGDATPFKNELGFSRRPLSAKLIEYLDYGAGIVKSSSGSYLNNLDDTDDLNFVSSDYLRFQYSALYLAAYQKIYTDYYRFEQWENNSPSLFNFDYLQLGQNPSEQDTHIDIQRYISQANNGMTLFDLRYCNWNKDLFHGLLPSAQYGDSAYVGTFDGFADSQNVRTLGYDSDGLKPVVGGTLVQPQLSNKNINSAFNFNILALRQAEFLQRWKEIAQFGKKDYKSQMEQHWNVKISDARSNLCTFIGGLQSNLNISEVVNTNITENNPAAIAGKSVGVGNGVIDYSVPEPGVLMCIYHCLPILDYSSFGTAPHNFKVRPTDFAIPEMDKAGMQLVPPEWLANCVDVYGNTHQGEDYLGYAPRYIEYKTNVDRVHGDFNNTLKDWVATLDFEYLRKLFNRQNVIWSYAAMKVNPSVMDTVFGVNCDSYNMTDQLSLQHKTI